MQPTVTNLWFWVFNPDAETFERHPMLVPPITESCLAALQNGDKLPELWSLDWFKTDEDGPVIHLTPHSNVFSDSIPIGFFASGEQPACAWVFVNRRDAWDGWIRTNCKIESVCHRDSVQAAIWEFGIHPVTLDLGNAKEWDALKGKAMAALLYPPESK